MCHKFIFTTLMMMIPLFAAAAVVISHCLSMGKNAFCCSWWRAKKVQTRGEQRQIRFNFGMTQINTVQDTRHCLQQHSICSINQPRIKTPSFLCGTVLCTLWVKAGVIVRIAQKRYCRKGPHTRTWMNDQCRPSH